MGCFNWFISFAEKCTCKNGISVRRQMQILNHISGNYQLQPYQFEGKPVYTNEVVANNIRYFFFGPSKGGPRWRIESTLGKQPGRGWIYSQPDSVCPENSSNKWGYNLKRNGKWIEKDSEGKIYVNCLEKGKSSLQINQQIEGSGKV